jgi:hypothetical protein
MSARKTVLPSVNAVESTLSQESETVCGNPVCQVRFPQSGLRIEPRRFCSDSCRMDAWIIRRTATLLKEVSDAKVIKILRSHL